MSYSIRRTACALVALVTAISPITSSIAAAQDYPLPPPGYRDPPPPQDYRDPPPEQQGYYEDDAPPPGYDGSQPPPPPPGYVADQEDAARLQEDRRYEAYAEDWSARNCIRARSNATTGAVIGGLFGALLGSSVAGRHDRGAGAVIGGLAGAAGGAVVGDQSSRDTSPGCPPGYVVSRDAPAFYYDGGDVPYYYAAPRWYRPWVFYEGRWAYRPYPYRAWYYRHYGYGRPYPYRGGYGWGYRHYRRW